ncbi:MAG: hypothetical protein NTV23_13490 [Propionibacteriales bacterium]|nr:hypothetical protein [Propionibacteriales bacterium]
MSEEQGTTGSSTASDELDNEQTRKIPVQPVASGVPRSANAPLVPPKAASTSATTLPVVRKGGYDTDAVDRHLRTTSAERAGLIASLNESQDRIRILAAENAQLREKLSENETPSYAGLGGRASEMLRLAEEQADDVLGEANSRAAAILAQAEREAAGIRARAESDADDMRVVQLGELDDQRVRTMAEIEAERRRLKADADDYLAAAQREADQLRLAVTQQTEALRTNTEHDVEQMRAGADREVTEARRIMAVERERLVREAAEHHATATTETQRLVAEAEARANAAEDRSREAINAANSHRDQTATDADALLSKARREAEQLVRSAKKEAESLRINGHAASEQALAEIKAEVVRVSKRRDAIVAQLGALKDVVSGFGKDDDADDAPLAAVADPTE